MVGRQESSSSESKSGKDEETVGLISRDIEAPSKKHLSIDHSLQKPQSDRTCMFIMIAVGLAVVLCMFLVAVIPFGPAAHHPASIAPPASMICPPGMAKGSKHFALAVQETPQSLPGLTFPKALSYNGSMNGPLIDVNLGDDISIDVVNNASSATSVHWHGMDQNGSSWSDGVGFVNQRPIPYGKSFRYRFIAGPAGTMMYHSHTGTTFADGLRGPLIVRDPRDPWLGSYDEERILMMTDPIATPSGDELLALQMGMGMGMGGSNPCSNIIDQDFSDSDFTTLLTNGKGWARSGNGTPEIIRVQSGKRYRLRFINAASNWAIKVNISSHSMDIIAISGGNVVRSKTQAVIATSGERFDVILTADQAVGNYWVHISTLTGLNSPAILSYEGAPEPLSDPLTKAPPLELGCQAASSPSVMDLKLSGGMKAHPSAPVPPLKSNKTLSIYLVNSASMDQSSPTNVLGGSSNRILGLGKDVMPSNGCALLPGTNKPSSYCWTLNWVNFQTSPNKIPFLFPGSIRTPQTYVQSIPLNSVVDLVVINIGLMVHPMHIHGQQFWVLGSGNGSPFISSNSSKLDPSKLNLVNPGLRDTFAVPQSVNGSYGWAVLRFKASNPGLWAFHCHIDLHAASGMFMAFQVDGWKLPPGIELC